MRRGRNPRPAVAVAWFALLLPATTSALEPRFDHRDQDSLLLEIARSRDTVSVAGGDSRSLFRTQLEIAYGFDVTGDGDELLLGIATRLGGEDVPESVRWSIDARYRGYFGTEELKTFFDVGLWVPVSPKVGIGPRVDLGVIWDFGRIAGLYASLGVGTALGQIRAFSIEVASGMQVRF